MVFHMVLSIVRKSARGKRGRSCNQVEVPPENISGEEPASINNMPSSVTKAIDVNVKPEPEITPEENLKTEVTSTSPITSIAGKEEAKPDISKPEDEVMVRGSTAVKTTTEIRTAIKGI